MGRFVEVLHIKDVPWASKQMWAPDAAFRNGRYYLFFPARDKENILWYLFYHDNSLSKNDHKRCIKVIGFERAAAGGLPVLTP